MDVGDGPSQAQPQAEATGCPTLVTSKEPVEYLRQVFSVDTDATVFYGNVNHFNILIRLLALSVQI